MSFDRKNFYEVFTLLNQHVNENHSGDHQCAECPKKFRIKASLYSHIKVVHRGIRYPCELCDKTTLIEVYLLSFSNCDICDKKYFKDKSALGKHVKDVHRTGNRLESQTEDKNSNASKLTFDGVHKCDTCDKTFKSFHGLKLHNRAEHLGILRHSYVASD